MEFDASLAEGPHAALGRLVGRYQGRGRLWMMPEKLDDDEPATAEFVALNGGQFVRHDYTHRIGGADQSGTMLLGCNLDRSAWQAAWVDTWHTGTDLMTLEGAWAPGATVLEVRTTYGDDGDWGWRITIERTGTGVLVRHYNAPPAELGDEYLAAELDLATENERDPR